MRRNRRQPDGPRFTRSEASAAQAGAALAREPAPALYAHLPFCRSRCSYCAFASGIYEESRADAYLEALAGELRLRPVFSRERPPSSVYLGGGTPSALSFRQLRRLLALLPAPGPGGEFTCELNPDSCDREKLRLLRDSGVTRCSFGAQTFDPAGLRLLERRHDAKTACRAVEEAAACGFASLSLDLIQAWPGQEVDGFLADLRRAAGLGVDHLSCYALSLEPGSRLAERFSPAGSGGEDDEEAESRALAFWRAGEEFLADCGFQHYETSNFARPGRHCRHNTEIWKGGEYLGLGAAAHSHLAGRRSANVGSTAAYLERLREGRSPEESAELLTGREKAREYAVFWLRLFEGADLGEFRRRAGISFEELYAAELPGLLAGGWLEFAAKRSAVRVPPRFQPILDAILAELV